MRSLQMRFTRQNVGSERGFTLLEALIAFVILAGGLLAAFRFHNMTMSTTAEAKVRDQATALARQKIEDLHNFQTLAEFEAIVVDGAGLDDYAGVDYAAAFTLTWDRDEGYGENPRSVEVTVAWADRDGVGSNGDGTSSVALSSIIWGHNPQDDAAGIALSYAHVGDDVLDYYADADGNPIDIGGGGGNGGEVTITPVTLYNYDDPDPDNPEATYYDISFIGDIIFTDAGLASVGITGSQHDGASCELLGDPAFQYSCVITRVPDGTTWSGTLSYNPAGNDAVCTPGPTLDIDIDQLTTFLELEVVVLTNNGACNQLTP